MRFFLLIFVVMCILDLMVAYLQSKPIKKMLNRLSALNSKFQEFTSELPNFAGAGTTLVDTSSSSSNYNERKRIVFLYSSDPQTIERIAESI